VYTIGFERGNGYASQLLEHLIKKYGDEMDIKLSCHPYGVSFISDEFGKKYKDLQEKTAKWYEKFGFVTFSREEYESSYKWIMIRNKNNI
jgi:GNAT superfamily N-acetyltransferase